MKNLLAIILALSLTTFADPVNGPQSSNSAVLANSTDTYTVSFYGSENALVTLSGDGDTDLDLYIFDNNGNLICKSITYGDDEYCSWTPSWTGRFTRKVVNRGSIRNYYRLEVR